MKQIAEQIVSFRKSRGWTQQDFADLLGKTRSAIAAYESGRTEPSITDVVNMAALFGCSTDQLLSGEPVTNSNKLSKKESFEEKENEYLKVIDRLTRTVEMLVGKAKAYLITQRVQNLDALLGTPGLK